MKVAYLGAPGTFSEMAVLEYFKGRAEAVSFSDFPSMFKAAEDGSVDFAVVPVENTTTGIISRTYDLFQHYDIFAVGEVNVPVKDSLIALPGTEFLDITEAYSHPEAILQCSEFFKKYPQIRPVAFSDTAKSVEHIKELGDKSKAAIASSRAAEFFGLPILLADIQDSDLNMTRFLCITNKKDVPDGANKISIMMTLKHAPGALYNALGIFAAKNLNVIKLESRPIPGRPFEYCFYLDFEGNLSDPEVAEALRRLEYDSAQMKVLGNYKAADKV